MTDAVVKRRAATMGRTTDCTPELIAKVCQTIKDGNRAEAAAIAAGVPRTSYYEWMAKGRAGFEQYQAFAEGVEKAQAQAEIEKMAAMVKGDQRDGYSKAKSAMFWLERARSQHYAEQQKLTVEVETEQLDFLRFIEELLGPETYVRVLTAWQDRKAIALERGSGSGDPAAPGAHVPGLLRAADVVDTEGEPAL